MERNWHFKIYPIWSYILFYFVNTAAWWRISCSFIAYKVTLDLVLDLPFLYILFHRTNTVPKWDMKNTTNAAATVWNRIRGIPGFEPYCNCLQQGLNQAFCLLTVFLLKWTYGIWAFLAYHPSATNSSNCRVCLYHLQ